MTDTNDKIRALFLTALMVFSVFAGTVALSGSAMAQAGNAQPYVNGGTYYTGNEVIITGLDANQELRLRNYDVDNDRAGTTSQAIKADEDGTAQFTLENGGEFVLVDANDRTQVVTTNDDGEFQGWGNVNTSNYIEVTEQDISAEFDPDEVGNQGDTTTTLEVSSDVRNDYSVNISSEDYDAEEIDELITSENVVNVDEDENRVTVSNAEDGIEFDFTDEDAGDYNFTVTPTDTSAEAEASVTVQDTADGTLSLESNTIEVAEGGIAEFNVSFNGAAEGGNGYLVVGSDDAGYQANISLNEDSDDDDNVVTVRFNTYTAGQSSGTIVEAEGDDSATLENQGDDAQEGIDEMLATTEDGYALSVRYNGNNESTVDDPDNVGSLYVVDRSTDALNVWTAPSSSFSDLSETEDVTDAIEEGTVTETDQVAREDLLVLQLEGSGLTGMFESDDGFSTSSSLYELNIEEADPRPNRDTRTVDLSSVSDVKSFVDEENGQTFIVIDTDGAEWNSSGDSISDDTDLSANFTVSDDRVLRSDDDDDHETVTGNFTFVDREVEFDQDPIQVGNADDQAITGTSTLAPGSEITIRLRSSGDTQPRFVKSNESVVIQSDGTFSHEFDFSEQEVGDTFEATASGFGDSVTIDGEVVESTATATPTDNGTTATGTPGTGTPTDEPTEPPTESPTEPPTTTTTTPGFTAVLALVALIGAALLATRRD